jgi:SAM-dependent methyltransferase
MLKVGFDDRVLDYGCGTGKFCEYLPGSVGYFAFDWSPEMRLRTLREHNRAWVVDELDNEVFDHVVCIGPFNLSDGWSKEQTWETLEELWTMHTRRSLVISVYRERGQTPSTMLGYSLVELGELVERLGSPPFVMRSDHLPNDLVVGLFRVADRDGAPAELPPRDVGRQQDPRG